MSGNPMDRGVTIKKPNRTDELLSILLTCDGKGEKAKKAALVELLGLWGSDQEEFYKLPQRIAGHKH